MNSHEPTFAEVFEGIPKAQNTETEQVRHAELIARMESQNYTNDDERECNKLFYTIYPQMRDIHCGGTL